MIKKLFSRPIPQRDPGKDYDKSDFSDFFIHAPVREQKKVISRSVKAANKEQRKLTLEASGR